MNENAPCFIFRVDASSSIGSGHLLRCLTLACGLRSKDIEVVFICRKSDSDLFDLILEEGFRLIFLDKEVVKKGSDFNDLDSELSKEAISILGKRVDWLIVDHYELDYRWEERLKDYVGHIMVIDDLSNRLHSCTLLLDQGYGSSPDRYNELTCNTSDLLLGINYSLLRPEFLNSRNTVTPPNLLDENLSLHIFFGMYDTGEMTLRATRWLLEGLPSVKVRVVIGSATSAIKEYEDLGDKYPGRLEWRLRPKNVASFMASCHAAIGAPGMSTWERACLGLPSLYIATTENQIPILERLKNEEVCDYMGYYKDITEDTFIEKTQKFLSNSDFLIALRNKSMKLCDGRGCERVVLKMLDYA